MSRLVAIYRSERLSPNSQMADAKILQSTTEKLNFDEKIFISEDNITSLQQADLILSMARLPQTLSLLKQCQKHGTRVINSVYAVEMCKRSTFEQIMRKEGYPIAPTNGKYGYWLKRADDYTQCKDDVVYCKDIEELQIEKEKFIKRGIKQYVINAHLHGDLIKFYAVGDSFFKFFYPLQDSKFKFKQEYFNDKCQFYKFNVNSLHAAVKSIAHRIGIEVYGGDCIISAKGEFNIIDFNDWPSFARCREEAATAIARLINH